MPTSDEAQDDTPDDSPEELVPDPQVWREFGVTPMTGHRWTNDPNLGFPQKIKIRERNFCSRKQIEAFKRRMLRQALEQRGAHPHVTRDAHG
jgi:hypothetical protein